MLATTTELFDEAWLFIILHKSKQNKYAACERRTQLEEKHYILQIWKCMPRSQNYVHL